MLAAMLMHRPAVDLADLRLADDLMSAAWSSGSPTCVGTPAAIEWWYAGSWPDALADHLRLWFLDDAPVAWTWHDSGELEWHVWSGDPERDRSVASEILATVVDEAADSLVGAWAADDDHVALALFETLGFRRAGRRLSQWQRHADEGAPPARAVPAGYTIRSVLGPDEIPARVDVHRSAFTGSRLNVEKYERLGTPAPLPLRGRPRRRGTRRDARGIRDGLVGSGRPGRRVRARRDRRRPPAPRPRRGRCLPTG